MDRKHEAVHFRGRRQVISKAPRGFWLAGADQADVLTLRAVSMTRYEVKKERRSVSVLTR